MLFEIYMGLKSVKNVKLFHLTFIRIFAVIPGIKVFSVIASTIIRILNFDTSRLMVKPLYSSAAEAISFTYPKIPYADMYQLLYRLFD